MTKLIVFISFLFHNYCFSQTEIEHVKSFVNDILLNENYDISMYQKHIHYYNQHSKEDKEEFEKYLQDMKFLTLNFVTKRIIDKNNINVIDITDDKEIVKAHLQDDSILSSYRIYGVFENKKFITAVIVDDKKNIISFLTSLTKDKSKPPNPLFLNESL